jgi:hypothetical protein
MSGSPPPLTVQGGGSVDQRLDFFNVNVDDENATGLTLWNGHYAHASLQSFATDHNLDDVTCCRQSPW